MQNVNSCNLRVDFRIEQADNNSTYGVIFLEIVEHQHNGYTISCDAAHMYKIIESLTIVGNTLSIQFIRYNPHDLTSMMV